MGNRNTAGDTVPDKSKLDLAKEAQAELQEQLTAQRLEMIETLREHKSIGGEDITEESLLAILMKNPGGIQFPLLQTVFPDAALIGAREALKKLGKIEQIGKKGNVVLKPIIAK